METTERQTHTHTHERCWVPPVWPDPAPLVRVCVCVRLPLGCFHSFLLIYLFIYPFIIFHLSPYCIVFIVFIHLPRLMHSFMSSWYVCLHYFICPVHSVCSSPCIPTATWYRFVWRPLLSTGFDCSRSGLSFCSGV